MTSLPRLTEDERATLLRLARAAIEARVLDQSPPVVAAVSGALLEPGAVFVTIRIDTRLRGCLGCIEPQESSLADTVIRLAGAVAAEDPRFDPLTAADLEHTRIDVSVLGPLQAIDGPDEIVIGRDGIVAEHGISRGLLLPHVACEWGWDPTTFVEEGCRKAGLPPSAWREGARLYRFEAEAFAERGDARGLSADKRPLS